MVKRKSTPAVKAVADPILRFPLISENEVMDREAKYMSRLNDFTVSADLVKGAQSDFYDQEVERMYREHWEHHLRCDGLPRPYLPVEVRTFISKIRFYDDVETQNSMDWTLSVDERSILNQNIFRVDRTRRLMMLNKDNPGTHYDQNVQMCLDALKEMDAMLDNEAEMVRMSEKRQKDVIEVYAEVETEIGDLFDRLTYRVLRMQDTYMESKDGQVAVWRYSCNPWRMDLWGLRNVPIIFEQLELPVMLAEFSATRVEVQIPKSVLTDCVTIRSLHTDFDNISQNAKSFDTAVKASLNYPTAGIVDIEESVINEWHMQHEIQEETLSLMLTRRREYEEMMLIIAEKTEQAAKAAKQTDPDKAVKIIIPKAPKEPPEVPTGMFPDIYEDFLRMEDSQYLGYLDEVYHPRHLDMQPFEINLREHIMLGGIYSIMFIRRPDQTQFEKFNIILHEDGRVVHILTEMKADIKTDTVRSLSIARKTRETYRGTRIKLEVDQLPYFIVTLQVPADLCKWSEPVVCHFMTEQDFVPADYKRESLWVPTKQSVIRHSEFAGRGSTLNLGSAVSRDSANVFRPSLRTLLRQSKVGSVAAVKVPIEDFKMQKKLNHLEIRTLERHCVPRIISSFKFPVEFQDEKREFSKQGPKALVKRAEEVVSQIKILDFNYNSQKKTPERMFPYFPQVDPIRYPIPYDDAEPGPVNPTTALEVLKTFDNIKSKYLEKPLDLLVQPDEQDKKQKQKKLGLKEEDDVADGQTGRRKMSRSGDRIRLSVRADRASVASEKSQAMTDQMNEVEVTHWTTKYIKETVIDRATNRITFKTDRLGLLGLAFKRYEHFPFRNWSMQPNEENPDEIILCVDTFHVRIFFYITCKGVKGYVTDLSKGYTANPVKYLEIAEPISDFRQMRQLFISKNINIFAENDASFYIENGYFSMKHMALEMHTYNIMALHCKLMKFYRSSWNRLAPRRDIILGMKIAKDNSDYSEVTMRITPEKTTFVQISENCSDKVNVIVLSYNNTWRNIGNFTDLHQAINSMVPNATEVRNKDSILLYYVTRMLKEIRLLSFS
ncbi:uncharacterized protein LOC6546147 [Drosophila erecta]|uniref:CASC1 C-terminal domain-containing protein n=1 Tax=Drosophila erecta TaxID=7220 RepID=B3NIU3_DROER|nr:uncharacterized protein LOC6546147 [Drosophila erecta]EDV52589.2 uncharacterized protein Dere_GG13268 [Drosophila erecta]